MKEVPNNEISEETVPIPEEILSVSKEELLKVAKMNIDDIKKDRLKKVFVCLGVIAVVCFYAVAASSMGMDSAELSASSAGFFAAASSIPIKRLSECHLALKIVKRGYKDYNDGNIDLNTYYENYLSLALEAAGKSQHLQGCPGIAPAAEDSRQEIVKQQGKDIENDVEQELQFPFVPQWQQQHGQR